MNDGCDRFAALISDALAGALGADDEEALAAHLVGCADCRSLAARWTSVDRALAERAAAERAPALRARLGAALARERRRRWRAPLAAAAALLIAAAAVAAWQRTRAGDRDTAATIVAASGDVAATIAGTTRAIGVGGTIPAGGVLTCGADATAVVTLRDGTRLELGGGARCAFAAADAPIELERGELTVAAAKQPPGRALAFATAQARVAVVGTRFTLAADARRTRVAVDDGVVRVASRIARQLPIDVAAGFAAEVAAGVALVAHPTAAPVPALSPPPRSGAFDVRAFGAVGDGIADDTTAIRRAIAAALATDPVDGDRIVHLPRGTYLVSDTLAWRDAAGGWHAYLRLQGDGRDATVLRLRDGAPGFADPQRPKALVVTGAEASDRADGGGSQGYGNGIADLAIEIGADDAGAVAIDWLANNDAHLARVAVTAHGRAVTGIDLRRPYLGPCLIDDVSISGFDRGVWLAGGISGACLTRVTLANQRIAGIENDGNVLAIEDLTSENAVPAVVSRDVTAFTLIVGASLVGGAADAVAIDNRDGAQHAARNVAVAGYRAAIDGAGAAFDVATSLPPLTLFAAAAPRPLALPIRAAPEPPPSPSPAWADVTAFGAVADDAGDDADAIQAAIDSGAEVVWLPRGRYRLGRTVEVRGAVRRIVGFGALLQPHAQRAFAPALRVAAGRAGVVTVERIAVAANYERGRVDFAFPVIEDASPATLVLRDLRGVSYANAPGAGDLFLENVSYGPCVLDHQRAWARRLTSHVVNRGGRLWVLDLHCLGAAAPAVATMGGGETEVLGGFCSTLADVAEPPLFVAIDARLSLSYATSIDADWRVQLRETRAGATRELAGNRARRAGSSVPLVVADPGP